MKTKTQLALAVMAALGLAAGSTFATTDSNQAGWNSWQGAEVSGAIGLLADKGRSKDGTKPEDDGVDAPDGCDDNGDDLACVASTTGSNAVLLASKGRGEDGTKPEDDGVDAPDGCDDNGDDLACS